VLGFDPPSTFDLPDVNHQLQKIKLPDILSGLIAAEATIRSNRTIPIKALTKLIAARLQLGLDPTALPLGQMETPDYEQIRIFCDCSRREAGSISLGLIQLQLETDPLNRSRSC